MLEIAKTEVERAILLQRGFANATDEATALTWMNQQLEALKIEISNSN